MVAWFCFLRGTQAQKSSGKLFCQEALADSLRPVEQQGMRPFFPVQEPCQEFFILLVSYDLFKHCFTCMSEKVFAVMLISFPNQ